MTSTQQPVTSTPLTQDEQIDALGRYKYGWADADTAGASARRGIDEDVVTDISRRKNEPEWMLERRLKALKLFGRKPMPDWGSDLSRSEEHTSELQSRQYLVCRLLLEKKKTQTK